MVDRIKAAHGNPGGADRSAAQVKESADIVKTGNERHKSGLNRTTRGKKNSKFLLAVSHKPPMGQNMQNALCGP